MNFYAVMAIYRFEMARMWRTSQLSTGNYVYEPFNEGSLILQMLFQ